MILSSFEILNLDLLHNILFYLLRLKIISSGALGHSLYAYDYSERSSGFLPDN